MKISKKHRIQRRDLLRKFTSPYCPVCTSCAEDGCCSPTLCSNDPKGKYCEYSMGKLKNTYWAWIDLMNFVYSIKNRSQIHLDEIKQEIDEIEDKYKLY